VITDVTVPSRRLVRSASGGALTTADSGAIYVEHRPEPEVNDDECRMSSSSARSSVFDDDVADDVTLDDRDNSTQHTTPDESDGETVYLVRNVCALKPQVYAATDAALDAEVLVHCIDKSRSRIVLTYRPLYPFSSTRYHLSYNDCLEDKKEDIRTVLCCVVYDSCAQ